MATTQFCFTTVGATTPVAFSSSASFEVKTPTGTSSATTASANASQTICRVATDTAVNVTDG